jgi:hypothetical protein
MRVKLGVLVGRWCCFLRSRQPQVHRRDIGPETEGRSLYIQTKDVCISQSIDSDPGPTTGIGGGPITGSLTIVARLERERIVCRMAV